MQDRGVHTDTHIWKCNGQDKSKFGPTNISWKLLHTQRDPTFTTLRRY